MKPTAYEGKEKYIFISYAHKDSDTVLRIMSALQLEGYRIWYDDGIIPGSEWPENIAMHLNDASMVIAMISPNSMASHNCRREINFALSKQKPFLSVILEPTEMSLGMEMQLSAQNIVMRHNYSNWDEFIAKIMLCPGLEPCHISDKEERERYVPRGMQMESQAAPFVYGAPAAAPAPEKKKKNPLVLICAVLGLCVAVLGAMMFMGKDTPNADAASQVEEPAEIIPMEYELDFTPTGELLVEGGLPDGTVQVYAAGERSFDVLLRDDWIPNGYTTSEIPGKRVPYWNVGLVGGDGDTISVNIEERAKGSYYRDCLYYHGNAIFSYGNLVDLDRQENTYILHIELPKEAEWTTADLTQVYVNLGTEDESTTDHYEFWS